MSEDMKSSNYIGYEYRDITVNRTIEMICADGYENFGWQTEDRVSAIQPHLVTLKIKRNRKMRNKAEINRLQRQFESCVNQIEAMDKAKLNKASIIAYLIGLIATAFMAGATFSYLAGGIPLMIILAIPGFAGWGLSYLCFVKVRRTTEEKVTPLIEQKYDEMYSICEKANGLLNLSI